MGGLDTKHGPVRTAHICVHTIAYNCRIQHTQNSSDNLPSYPPSNHHISDDATGVEGALSCIILLGLTSVAAMQPLS